MNTEGILCQVDTERFASLVSPALTTDLNMGYQQLCLSSFVVKLKLCSFLNMHKLLSAG